MKLEDIDKALSISNDLTALRTELRNVVNDEDFYIVINNERLYGEDPLVQVIKQPLIDALNVQIETVLAKLDALGVDAR